MSKAATKAPTEPEPQGKVHVRMPRALHAQLLDLRTEQGVSLNQLMVSLIAGGVGFKLDSTNGDGAGD